MKIALILLILMTSINLFAQTRIVSLDAFDTSYTGGLLIKTDKAKTGSDYEESNFRLNLNYAQSIEQYVGLMWKAQAFLNRRDYEFRGSDTLDSRWGAAVGALYNFQHEDIKNSFLASGSVGLERQALEIAGGDDEAGFNLFFLFEGGKRWDMGHYAKLNVSYAPTVSFQWKRYGGDLRDEYFKSGTEFRINFLKFDVLF
jgi:hypothetical protein